MMIGPAARLELGETAPLLPGFGAKYPLGWTWLERRLAAAEAGEARLWVAQRGGEVAAFALETPKGTRQSKLSTFVVAPSYRGQGLGKRLLRRLRTHWLDRGLERVHVTVDRDDVLTQAFFERHGFDPHPAVLIPYGPGRFDRLFQWCADRDPLAGAAAVH